MKKWQRILSALLMVSLVLSGMTLPSGLSRAQASASGISGTNAVKSRPEGILSLGEWLYYLEDGDAVIAGYADQSASALSLPNELDGHIVSGIGANAFSGYSQITLTVHSLVTKISRDAFAESQGVTLRAYSGAYALRYARELGLSAVNITNLEGSYTLLDHVIDIAGFPQRQCAVLDDTTLRVSSRVASLLSPGDDLFLSARSNAFQLKGGKVKSIVPSGEGTTVYLESVDSPGDICSNLSGTRPLMLDLEHYTPLIDGASIETDEAQGSLNNAGDPYKFSTSFKIQLGDLSELKKLDKSTTSKSLKFGGSIGVTFSGSLIYDLPVSVVYPFLTIKTLKTNIDMDFQMDFKVVASLKRTVPIITIPITEPHTRINLGDIIITLEFGIDGTFSIGYKTSMKISAGVENYKPLLSVSKESGKPTVSASIKGFINYVSGVQIGLGFELLGKKLRINVMQLKAGPGLELETTFSRPALFTDVSLDVGACIEATVTAKLKVEGAVGAISVTLGTKELPLPIKVTVDQSLQLHKGTYHFDQYKGDIKYASNCLMKNKSASFYNGGTCVATLDNLYVGQHLNTLEKKLPNVKGSKEKPVFDGWWLNVKASGLTGKDFTWDFNRDTLPLLDANHNYVFYAGFRAVGAPPTKAGGSNQLSVPPLPDSAPGSGSTSSGSGSYGGYYAIPTLPPAPTPIPEPTATPTPVPETQVSLSVHSSEVFAGDAKRNTVRLLSTLKPDNAGSKDVFFTSSDETVAYVDGDGVVTGLEAGEVTITCASVSNPSVKDTCTVTVHRMADNVYILGDAWGLTPGDKVQLEGSVYPSTADNTSLIWQSSDESVASVSQTGLLEAHAIGECTVTATAADGAGAADTLLVQVGPPLSITTSIEEHDLYLSGTENATLAYCYLAPAVAARMLRAGYTPTWQWDDPESDTVDMLVTQTDTTYTVDGKEYDLPLLVISSGEVKAAGARTFRVTCSAGPYTASAEIPVTVSDNVIPAFATLPVTTYALSEGEVALIPGTPSATGDGTLPVGLSPASLVGDALFDARATVYTTESGLGVAFAESGVYTATVTYTVSNVSYAIPLTFEVRDEKGILHLPVQSVALSLSDLTLIQGTSQKLSATVLPADAYEPGLIWSSDNEEIATVDADGTVHALQSGICIISCEAKDGSGYSDNMLVTVEKYLQLSDHDLAFTLYTGNLTRSELNVCALTLLSSERLSADGLDVTWKIEKLSGDAVDLTLEQLETAASSAARVEGNRLRLLRVNHVGTDVYLLSAQAGTYTDTCEITLTVVDGSTLPQRLALAKDSYEVTVGEALTIDPSVTCYPEGASLPEDAEVTLRGKNGFDHALDESPRYSPFEMTFAYAGTYEAEIVFSGANYAYTLPVTVTVKDENGNVPLVAQELTLSESSLNLFAGETFPLSYTVLPQGANDGGVSWTSSNTAVATVDHNGVVTAVDQGTAIVFATTTLGACTDITVVRVETGLTLEEAKSDITVFLDGETRTALTTVWLTESSSKRLSEAPTWALKRMKGTTLTLKPIPVESRNSEGDTIYGCIVQLYSASSEGETSYELTCASEEDSTSLILRVTASQKDRILPASISMATTEFTADVGELISLAPSVSCWPEGTALPQGTEVSLEADRAFFSSVDSQDYFVSQSLATLSFTRAGRYEASLVFRYANAAYTVPLTFFIRDETGFVPVHGKKLALSSASLFLEKGDTALLKAVFTPDDTSEKRVTWESSDPQIAQVDENGLVTAKGLGSAVITCIPRDEGLESVSCGVYVEDYLSLETGDEAFLCYLEGEKALTLPSVRLSEGTIRRLERENVTPEWTMVVTSGTSAALTSRVTEGGNALSLSTENLLGKGTTAYTVTCKAGDYTCSKNFTVNVQSLGVSAPEGISLKTHEVTLALGEKTTVDFSPVLEPAGSTLPAGMSSVYMGLGDFYDALDSAAYVRNGDSVTVAFQKPGTYLLARTYSVLNLSYTALCVFHVEEASDLVHFLNASETQCTVYPALGDTLLSSLDISDAGILERFGDVLEWTVSRVIGESAEVTLVKTDTGASLVLTGAPRTGVTIYNVACSFAGVRDSVDIAVDVREARKPLPESISLSTDHLSGTIGNWLYLPLGALCAPTGSALPETGDELWSFALRGQALPDVAEALIEDGMLKINFTQSGYFTGHLTYHSGNLVFNVPVYFTVADEESVVPAPKALKVILQHPVTTVYPEGETPFLLGEVALAEHADSASLAAAAAFLKDASPAWSVKAAKGSSAAAEIRPLDEGGAELYLTKISGSGDTTFEISCTFSGKTYTEPFTLHVAGDKEARPTPELATSAYETREGESLSVDARIKESLEGSVLQAKSEWKGETRAVTDSEGVMTLTYYTAGAYTEYIEVHLSNLRFTLPVTIHVQASDVIRKAMVVRLPLALTEIEAEAFRGTGINVADLASTHITSFGERAFADCTGLTDIYLPDTLVDIAPTAFAGSPNVTIHCAAGSAAERFALENNLPCVYITK